MSEFFFKGMGKTGRPIKGDWTGTHYVYTEKKRPKKHMEAHAGDPSESSDVTKDTVGVLVTEVANPNRVVPKKLRLSPYMKVSTRSQRHKDAEGNVVNPARYWLRANEEASRSELSTQPPDEQPSGPDPRENPILAAMMEKMRSTKKSVGPALFISTEEE